MNESNPAARINTGVLAVHPGTPVTALRLLTMCVLRERAAMQRPEPPALSHLN